MPDTPQSKGGAARAQKLTKEQRSEIARRGAQKRWADAKGLPKATHGSPDRPLRIGDIEIPCYVLEDGTRVLSQRGTVGGLGMKYGSSAGGADRLTAFLNGKGISTFVSNDLMALTENPIKFRHTGGGNLAFGYPATILADICDVVLEARKAGALQKQQEHIADRAEILLRGFARVGIIALVDEATGYQEERDRHELQRILGLYLSDELLPWTERFPITYYKEMFRLWGWPWPPRTGIQGPRYAGKLTNQIVYNQLPSGVLDELKARAPANNKWQRGIKLHQWMSEDIGQPHLEKQVAVATKLMQACDDKEEFRRKFERAFPGSFSAHPSSKDDDEH